MSKCIVGELKDKMKRLGKVYLELINGKYLERNLYLTNAGPIYINYKPIKVHETHNVILNSK